MTGPVLLVLEQEILGELRRQGIVVWLDWLTWRRE
jgi:hypothetical protein